LQYYPICLNITNKRCVVIGGGEVGARKVERLLDCGAQVVVVSLELTTFLEGLREEGRISQVAAEYAAAYLEGAYIVIGATNNDEVNSRIFADARSRGILVNIADDPLHCDFILPALVRQGDLQIAISTGGKSPALARKLREDLAPSFGPEYAKFIDLMGELRERVKAQGYTAAENKRIFDKLVHSDLLHRLREGNGAGVRECLRGLAGPDMEFTGCQATGDK